MTLFHFLKRVRRMRTVNIFRKVAYNENTQKKYILHSREKV
jgi:hypothetical protein